MKSPMKKKSLLLLCLLLILADYHLFLRRAEAGKRRVQIPDELDDVVDDEEDEEWKEWGKKSSRSDDEFDPPPDFSNMEMSQIQAEVIKRQAGTVFGFVKLRLGVKWTPEMVTEIAVKWSQLSRTGAIETRFTAFDRNTIMISMDRGQDSLELKEFILSQPEAYEMKLGDQFFRRPGDPPLEELVEKLKNEKNGRKDDEL